MDVIPMVPVIVYATPGVLGTGKNTVLPDTVRVVDDVVAKDTCF